MKTIAPFRSGHRVSTARSLLVATAAGLAVSAAAPPPDAVAQSYYSPYYTSNNGKRIARAKPRQASPARAARAAKTEPKAAAPKGDGPLTLVVSLGQQRVTVYDRNGVVTQAPISSGAPGHRTPTGVFSILEKNRVHFSNLYYSAPMPNMQRITWSGIALHAGQLPGYPASHGCIRLPASFSRTLFSMTTVGTRVVVAHENAEPRPIRHASLLKPLPPGEPLVDVPTSKQESEPAPRGRAADAARMMLGVTPAAAAGEPSDASEGGGQRTRASVAASRRRQLAVLEVAVKDSEAWRKGAHDKVVAANAELQVAMNALVATRKSVGEIDKRMRDALAAKATADTKLKTFLTRTAQLTDPVKIAAAESEEDRIEADALAALAAYDAALVERKAIGGIISGHEAATEQARTRRGILADGLKTATEALAQATASLNAAKRAEKRAEKPITVVISRKTGKLYVRQGWDDLLEAKIEIATPKAPLGTQVFHAIAYTADGADLEWRALTAARSAPKVERKVIGKKRGRPIYEEVGVDTVALPQTPAEALQRVKIPVEVAEVLAEHIKPNSAIIITDEGKSPETGKFTDLIVSTY